MPALAKTILSRIFFLLVVLGSAYAAYDYFKKEKLAPKVDANGEVVAEDSGLKLGKRYRIFIRSLIVPPTNEDGDKWDGSGKSGAPDVFFRVFYQDHMIYESSTISDVLVAEYAAVKGGVTDAIFSKNASDYLEAANVAFQEEDSHFKVKVIDSDTFDNDTIGEVTIALNELNIGSNTIEKSGVTYVITVIDSDTDMNESLKALKVIK